MHFTKNAYLTDNQIIPEHKFWFRTENSTNEQIRSIVNVITSCLQGKKYCSATFLDVQQAFSKIWFPGQLYKLKLRLTQLFYLILQNSLSDQKFKIKHNNYISTIFWYQVSRSWRLCSVTTFALYLHSRFTILWWSYRLLRLPMIWQSLQLIVIHG